MAFGFLKSKKDRAKVVSKTVERDNVVHLKDVVQPERVGVIDGNQPQIEILYRVVTTYLGLYLVDADDGQARASAFPGGVLPELLPGLFNALRTEILADELGLLEEQDEDAMFAAMPKLLASAGKRLRVWLNAKADGDSKAHRQLERVRGIINADCVHEGLLPQRFTMEELSILSDLLRVDSEIRPIVIYMAQILNPEIVDRHGEVESEWFGRWERAVNSLRRDLRTFQVRSDLGELPKSTIALVFVTLMNRRIVRPGQMVLLLKSYLTHIEKEAFDEETFRFLVTVLMSKLADHEGRLSAMLMNELRHGLRQEHLVYFSYNFREFHSIYYAMLEELSLAGHPSYGKPLSEHYIRVLEAILEKLMPAVGTLVFDTFPDPHRTGQVVSVRREGSTSAITDDEKIPLNGESDVLVMVPFFRMLREAARDCGMDKPAREVERGLITGLNFRLKSFVSELKSYLEQEEPADFKVISGMLAHLDQLYDALEILGFETAIQNAKSYIRTALKLSVKYGNAELRMRKGQQQDLKRFLDVYHEELSAAISRLVFEQQADLADNGRFSDASLIEVMDDMHSTLQACYPDLQAAIVKSLTLGDLAQAERILMICDKLASAFVCDKPRGRLAQIAKRQPTLVRDMLRHSIEVLLNDVANTVCSKEMKFKLLSAAEAVKRLHDHFYRKGDRSTAGALLKQLQLGLVAFQTGAARA